MAKPKKKRVVWLVEPPDNDPSWHTEDGLLTAFKFRTRRQAAVHGKPVKFVESGSDGK